MTEVDEYGQQIFLQGMMSRKVLKYSEVNHLLDTAMRKEPNVQWSKVCRDVDIIFCVLLNFSKGP